MYGCEGDSAVQPHSMYGRGHGGETSDAHTHTHRAMYGRSKIVGISLKALKFSKNV